MVELRLIDIINRESLSLIFSSAFVGLGGAFIVTTLSLFLFQEVGVSALWVGLFFAVRALSEIASDLIIGYVSENHSKRHIFAILCTLLSACGAVLLMYVRDYYTLMLGSVVFFGLGGAIFPQLFALTRDVAENRHINVSGFNAVMRAMTSASWVIGPPLAFILIDITSFTVLYGFAAACYLIATIALLVGQFQSHAKKTEKIRFKWRYLTPRTYGIMIFVLLLLTINMVYQINIALYISQELNLATSTIGLIVGLGSALEVPLILLFGLLANKVSTHILLLFGAMNACLFFVLLGISSNTWQLMLIQIPNAIWVAIVLSLPIMMLQDELKQFHGMASSLFSSAFKFGTFFGGSIGGVLLANLGFQQTFFLCALLSILGGFAILCSQKKELSHAV